MKKINNKTYNTHIKLCGVFQSKKKICKNCKNTVLEKRMESHKNFCIKQRKKYIKIKNNVLDLSKDFNKNIIKKKVNKVKEKNFIMDFSKEFFL